jgi:hypothetical protein
MKHGLRQRSDAAHQPLFRGRPCLAHHPSLPQFQRVNREWVKAESSGDMAQPDDRWSEAIAVGSVGFVEQVKNELGFRAQHREVWWRTVCILFENGRRLTATISIEEMRL